MKILWGEPNNPGEMNFKTETLLNKSKAASTDYWTVHPIIQCASGTASQLETTFSLV